MELYSKSHKSSNCKYSKSFNGIVVLPCSGKGQYLQKPGFWEKQPSGSLGADIPNTVLCISVAAGTAVYYCPLKPL